MLDGVFHGMIPCDKEVNMLNKMFRKMALPFILVIALVVPLVIVVVGNNERPAPVSANTALRAMPTAAVPLGSEPRILDAFTDLATERNYFLIDVGYIEHAYVSTIGMVHFNGTTPVTMSRTDITETTISHALTETVSNSVTVTDTNHRQWSLQASMQRKLPFIGTFRASVNRTFGSSDSTSTNNSTTVSTNVEEAQRVASQTSVSFTIGNHGEEAGWYRYALYSIVDTYFVVTTSLDNQELLDWDVVTIPRDNFFPHFEFSPVPHFDNTPASVMDRIIFDDHFYRDLPQPEEFESHTHLISNAQQLNTALRADLGGDFTLINDIDLGGFANWQPINGFSGTFNGRGHTISNLRIDIPTTQFTMETNFGLFARLTGNVKNLNMAGVNISGAAQHSGAVVNVGSVAGLMYGEYASIENVAVSGSMIIVRVNSWTGGIVGQMRGGNYINNATTSNLVVQMSVGNIGGIVGRISDGLVSNSITTGFSVHYAAIEANSRSLGGIVAYAVNSELRNIFIDNSTIFIVRMPVTPPTSNQPRVGLITGSLNESYVSNLTISSCSRMAFTIIFGSLPTNFNRYVGRGNSGTSGNLHHPVGRAIDSYYHGVIL